MELKTPVRTRPKGFPPATPGSMSLIMDVVMFVPSVRQSSRPAAGVVALKSSVGVVEKSAVAGCSSVGTEEPAPGTMSWT